MLNASFAVSQDDGSLSILFDSLRARCPDGCGWRGWKIIDMTILDLFSKFNSSKETIDFFSHFGANIQMKAKILPRPVSGFTKISG